MANIEIVYADNTNKKEEKKKVLNVDATWSPFTRKILVMLYNNITLLYNYFIFWSSV